MNLNPDSLLSLIVAIVAIGYCFDQVLEFMNLRARRTDIPDDVAAFYERGRYTTALAYQHDRTKFSFITSAFSFLLTVIMLLAGGFGWLDAVLRGFVSSEVALAILFFGAIMIASDILSLPFQLYRTFVIEERYGFNRMTLKTFVADKLKGYFLAALIGIPLISLLIYLVQSIGPAFWIWFSLVAIAFVLFMNIFYTSLILPLFNKLTPLPDGELKSAIEAFALKVQFPLENIFVIDGSKRSSKANAFFSGLGRRKKVVLYDTLIQKHTTAQLVAILAHEVGHFRKKHIVWGLVLSIIQIVFMLFILSLIVYNKNLSFALGGSQWSIHLNLVAFSILFTPVSGVTGLLMSIYSRKNEFEADRFARETYSGPALAEALKVLSVDSLSNLYPHPWYVFFHYSHPPLLRRLAALENGR